MNNPIDAPPWKISLHGGHSGQYCDHASGTLREVLEAAVSQGYSTFGVTEHAPRLGDRFLYDEERQMGWDVPKLISNFETYAEDIRKLSTEFDGRLTVLRGFEIEVVPDDRYAEVMSGYRRDFVFEYMVGSVHHVDEILIDGPPEVFQKAVDSRGGLENLGVAYYESVARMIEALQPEVVAHLDLIRKNAPSNESVESPRLRDAAVAALEIARQHGCILDVNTAGYRKGLGSPYPSPWLVQTAQEMGIGFCFGDDSHSPRDVGSGLEDAKQYLIENGVEAITNLVRDGGGLTKRNISLV